MWSRALASLCVLAAVGLSACGGAQAPDVAVTPVPVVNQSESDSSSTVPEVSQSEDASRSGPAGADANQTQAAHDYFTGLVSNDPDQETDAVGDAAKGSFAAAYVQHLANVDNADTDNGDTQDPEDLTEDAGVYGYCPGGDTESEDCVKWANVTFNGGKVASFTVNGKTLDKRLTLGSGDTIKAGGLAKVTFLSAYQSVQSNSVFVAFRVKTGNKKVVVATYDATYRSPDGRQSNSSDNGGPSDIDKNSTATVYSVFKRAKPGGVVKLQVFNAKTFEGPTLSVKTR